MKEFSKNWKSSTKPNKQRKYRFNAPLHIRGSFMNAHLSKDLRQKHKARSLRLRTGDKVRIMRGQFKGQEGKVEDINLREFKVIISKMEHTKRDGSKARYPINPSNLMIVELADSKKRLDKSSNTAKIVKTATPKDTVQEEKIVAEKKSSQKSVKTSEKSAVKQKPKKE